MVLNSASRVAKFSLTWLSLRFGVAVPKYVLAVMMVIQKTSKGRLLCLVSEAPARNIVEHEIKKTLMTRVQPGCHAFTLGRGSDNNILF